MQQQQKNKKQQQQQQHTMRRTPTLTVDAYKSFWNETAPSGANLDLAADIVAPEQNRDQDRIT
jgi:hypothetical protein